MKSITRIVLMQITALLLLSATCEKDDPNASCILYATITITDAGATNHLVAIGHDGLEPYTYLWSTGDITQSIDVLKTENATVTITDALACTATETAVSTECPPTMSDIDGNIYNVVRIGGHCWTVENLRTTKYRNGTSIYEEQSDAGWEDIFISGVETPAWCYYDGEPAYDATYGKLYNWYAVDDSRGLAPEGWHVATNAEYLDMISALGGLSVAGGKMKGLLDWFAPNTGADNSSGFSAAPGGLRWEDGHFSDQTFQAFFWTDDFATTDNGRYINLFYNTASVLPDVCNKSLGFSVRCVRDE